MKLRRRSKEGTPDSESGSDEAALEQMGMTELMEELAKAQAQIDHEHTEIGRLFDEKVAGRMHDGHYNIAVSSIGQLTAPAHKKKERLLVLIDKKMREMARQAIKDNE